MTIEGKKIVIIGGSSGIGLFTAKLAVKAGAHVVISGRSDETLQKAKAEIGANIETIPLDISKEIDVEAYFKEVKQFDHLVTMGGKTTPGGSRTQDTVTSKTSFDMKFWGQYYAVKYGTPFINKGGSIVLFSGVYSQRPSHETTIMSAVNSAIEGLGRALAVELAPIRVNTIAPGFIETERFASVSGKKLDWVLPQIPMGRVGSPEEIAEAVIYLMSNGYSTGNTLYFDGGYTLR